MGGGEIGRPGYPVETTKLDRAMAQMTGKKKPKLLFLPTASDDSTSYFEIVKKHFGKRIGCSVDVLYLIKDKLVKKQIEEKILSADIIYVGGGDTGLMMRVWKKTGTDVILQKAYNRGTVMAGLSAGSICWFLGGPSDTKRMKDPSAPLVKINGLGFIKALHAPHFDVEKDRRPAIQKMTKRTGDIAICLDNCCALMVQGNEYRIVTSRPDAKAYKIYWKGSILHEELIPAAKTLSPLRTLLSKH